ncbi:MAG: THUMP domain-containing protein [Deltaproteobacteria bacterium]|nr:THUMP domain-containing protein [Deltaproteobacteria bacterium]
MQLHATTAPGLEQVLARELASLGAKDVAPAVRGVSFRGDLELAYRANLWLRTASRVLLALGEIGAGSREELYAGIRAMPWEDHMSLDKTLAVEATSHKSELTHTQFAARVVKDAVVDRFRDRTGRRPDVNPKRPDLLIAVRLLDNRCWVSLDLSGERLHRRGYRPPGVPAPLQETLAAGVLMLSGYDGAAPIVDPMCGSGTLLVEAALMAMNMAPGLLGRDFGFMRLPGFDEKLWRGLKTEARALVRESHEPFVAGSDISDDALRATRASARTAGVDGVIRIRRADVADLAPRTEGMLVTNPPYGERLGEQRVLAELYRALGDNLKHRCVGMNAHVLTGSKYLAGCIGLHPHKRDILWNGPIECRLLHFRMY